uniref:Thioredoxin-like protein 1 n=1 Tax=Schistocephalus solidus TaxID=70667 RepID=A0A0X3NQ90_SCHSO
MHNLIIQLVWRRYVDLAILLDVLLQFVFFGCHSGSQQDSVSEEEEGGAGRHAELSGKTNVFGCVYCQDYKTLIFIANFLQDLHNFCVILIVELHKGDHYETGLGISEALLKAHIDEDLA